MIQKRELTKLAKAVLGPDGYVSITRYGMAAYGTDGIAVAVYSGPRDRSRRALRAALLEMSIKVVKP